jgi:hypothetical protein
VCIFLVSLGTGISNAGTVNASTKNTDCYLGLLYTMEDVAVYGYVTPLKVKIILALALSDAVIRDSEIIMVSKYKVALSLAYSNFCIPDM